MGAISVAIIEYTPIAEKLSDIIVPLAKKVVSPYRGSKTKIKNITNELNLM